MGTPSPRSGAPSSLRSLLVMFVAAAVAALFLSLTFFLRARRHRTRNAASAPLIPSLSLNPSYPAYAHSNFVTTNAILPEFDLDWDMAGKNAILKGTVSGSDASMLIGSSMEVKGELSVPQVLAQSVVLSGSAGLTPPTPQSLATSSYLRSNTRAIPVKGSIIMWTRRDKVPGGRWFLCDGVARKVTDENGVEEIVTPPDLTHMFIRGTAEGGQVGKTGGRNHVFLGNEHLPRHNHHYARSSSWPAATQTTHDHTQHAHSVTNLYTVDIEPSTAPNPPMAYAPQPEDSNVGLRGTADQFSRNNKLYTRVKGADGQWAQEERTGVDRHDHNCTYIHSHVTEYHGSPAKVDLLPKRTFVAYYIYL
jgi:hypothetical protein